MIFKYTLEEAFANIGLSKKFLAFLKVVKIIENSNIQKNSDNVRIISFNSKLSEK